MSTDGDQLPDSWTATTLGELIDYGRTEKAEPHDIAPDTWVLELEDVERDSARVVQQLTFTQRQSKSTKNRFAAGDVLYGKLRPYLNKVVHASSPGVCTTEIVPLKPNRAVVGRYLFYGLRHPAFRAYVAEASHGVNMPRLGTEAGKRAPFVLAPYSEQQRIADKLDTVLARVDACRDRLARVAPLLKRFRQSVLAAAYSGRLSEDWPEAFPESRQSFADLGTVSGGLTKNARREALSLRRPYLRVANVYANELLLSDVAEIGLTPSEFEKTRLQPGDLLIVEGNGSIDQIGRVAIWADEVADCCHQNHLIRWRAGPSVMPKFGLYYLLSPEGRGQIERVASSTTGLHTLSVSKVGALLMPLPTIDHQREIVRRVETLFSYADRLEARLAAAQSAVDRLTPALLAKAFRGELVPQDPADEPASELLRRLAQSRSTPAPKPRKRQTA